MFDANDAPAVEGGKLTPEDLKAVQDDTNKAFQDAAKKFDAPPSPAPSADGAAPPPTSPPPASELDQVGDEDSLPEWTAEDVVDILTYAEVELEIFPADSPMWHAPSDREKVMVAKPGARVLQKWMPFAVTKWRDEIGLGLAVLMIYVARKKNAKRYVEARAIEKKKAEENARAA